MQWEDLLHLAILNKKMYDDGSHFSWKGAMVTLEWNIRTLRDKITTLSHINIYFERYQSDRNLHTSCTLPLPLYEQVTQLAGPTAILENWRETPVWDWSGPLSYMAKCHNDYYILLITLLRNAIIVFILQLCFTGLHTGRYYCTERRRSGRAGAGWRWPPSRGRRISWGNHRWNLSSCNQ